MSATGMFDDAIGEGLSPVIRLPRQLLLPLLYLPSIALTVLGPVILSMCWVPLVNATPGPFWLIMMGIVQIAWIVSLVDVWLQNTYSILRRDLPAISERALKVQGHP